MGRLKKFFFGGSSSKHKRRNSADDSKAGPSNAASPSAASAASPTPSQGPHRKNRLRRSLSMKRLRRSFRSKDTSYVPPASKPHQWQQDEKLVRAGTCNFTVKYLGSIEVGESRGMQICEDAARQLRMNTRKKLRAVLWVSSDGLRVVEEESKGLIVDQTIEKVSFCAPDRNNDKGFSYICRDGTTRRWLCHCFHSLREPGERLSHAVGCAFAACLERKQQRDKLCGVKVEFDVNKTSFTRQGSFRVPTMTEAAMEAAEASQTDEEKENEDVAMSKNVAPLPHAIPRRHASSDMLIRQGSVRLGKINEATPFKRQLSLRLNDLPSTLQRQQQVLQTHAEVSPPTSPQETPTKTPATNGHSAITNGSREMGGQQGPESISAACAQLSAGLFQMSEHEEAAAAAAAAAATTPPPVPQRPNASQHHPVQRLHGESRTQRSSKPGILRPEPGPIKQKNPWEGSPMAPPPGSVQPTPPPRPKPTPGLTQITPMPGTAINPWAGVTPPSLNPSSKQSDHWSQPNPFGAQGSVNGQQVAAVQVHGGGMQNGVGMHPQPISTNFNNANNMGVQQQQQYPGSNQGVSGGIGGTWTADLSRTLPQNAYSANQQPPAWSGPPPNQTSPQQANNPFNNAVKTFEINL